ncbi:MAG: PCP reductase family protein [Chloroflexi bacterium]|nr:PCP reductase family protein [Chloroflexota bacterium]
MEGSIRDDHSSLGHSAPLVWTPETETYMKQVPGVFRRQARAAIEQFARERGYLEITPAVMKEARLALLGY